MIQMTSKQNETIVRLADVLQNSNYEGEIADVIHDFMYAMPESGPLDAKVAQELFHDAPSFQDIDAKDANGNTLLHHFLRHSDGQNEEHKQALDQILSYNPNPFMENNEGMAPMSYLSPKNVSEFLPVMSKYASYYNKNLGNQMRELLAYAVIMPDETKDLASFKTSRQGFEAIADKLAGKKGER